MDDARKQKKKQAMQREKTLRRVTHEIRTGPN
jgi:hypothetical protein